MAAYRQLQAQIKNEIPDYKTQGINLKSKTPVLQAIVDRLNRDRAAAEAAAQAERQAAVERQIESAVVRRQIVRAVDNLALIKIENGVTPAEFTEDITMIGDFLRNPRNANKQIMLADNTTVLQIPANMDKATRNRLFDVIFQAVPYDEEFDGTAIRVLSPVEYRADAQIFRLEDPINCLIGPIIRFVKEQYDKAVADGKSKAKNIKTELNKLEEMKSEFEENGATEANIQWLCNYLKYTISIKSIINTDYKEFKPQKISSANILRHFDFINLRHNHVEISNFQMSGSIEIEQISESAMIAKLLDLCRNKQVFECKQFKYKTEEPDARGNIIISDKQRIAYIVHNNVKYVDNEYIDFVDAINDLKEQLKPTVLNLNFAAHEEFLMNGIGPSQCSQGFKPNQSIKNKKIPANLAHIDISKSYSVFDGTYGVPVLTTYWKREVGDIEPFNASDKHGFFRVTITNHGTLHNIIRCLYPPNSFCSSERIRQLDTYGLTHGVSYRVEEAMFGLFEHAIHVNFESNKQKLQQHFVKFAGKAPYVMAASYTLMDTQKTRTQSFYADDISSIPYIPQRLVWVEDGPFDSVDEEFSADNWQKYYGMKLFQVNTKCDDTNQHHQTSIVYGLQVLQNQLYHMEMQLLQFRRQHANRVFLMYGDDIYYDNSDNYKPTLMNYFREKPVELDTIQYMLRIARQTFVNVDKLTYKSTLESSKGKPLTYIPGQFQFHVGAGGHGKSYFNHNNLAHVGRVYLAPTNLLVQDQRQYNTKCHTFDKFNGIMIPKHLHTGYHTILIDECSMLTKGQVQELIDKIPYAKFILMGDKLQLQAREDLERPDNNVWDLPNCVTVDGYNTDHRAKDPKLVALKLKIRELMESSNPFNEQELYKYVTEQIQPENIVKVENLKENYSIQDMIVACTHVTKNKINEGLKDIKKYRIMKTFTNKTGKFCTGEILKNPDFTLTDKQYEHQNVFTCHSLQGSTFTEKLFITKPTSHECFRGYVYTAVSRCQHLSQLYALIE